MMGKVPADTEEVSFAFPSVVPIDTAKRDSPLMTVFDWRWLHSDCWSESTRLTLVPVFPLKPVEVEKRNTASLTSSLLPFTVPSKEPGLQAANRASGTIANR